jgi:MOSC N-terminal beta barrel domain
LTRVQVEEDHHYGLHRLRATKPKELEVHPHNSVIMADSTGAMLFLGLNAIISSLLVRERMRTSAAVSEIWIYPIKSCRGIKVSSAVVGKRGFLLDRIFMLIDEEGKFVSQRTQPKMALIDVNIDEKSEVLTITAPGMVSPLTIDLKSQPSSGEKSLTCTVWGEDCTAYRIPTAGEWFSTYLGVASDHFRLVRMAGTSEYYLTPPSPAC